MTTQKESTYQNASESFYTDGSKTFKKGYCKLDSGYSAGDV